MDNPSINIQSQHCSKHNQPILFYDKNGKNPQCQGCLVEKGELVTVESIQKQYQDKIINHNKENDSQLQYLFALRDGILKYKEIIITSLDKSIQQIIDQINTIQSQKQSMQQLDQIMNKYQSIEDLKTYLNNNQKYNSQIKNQIQMNLLNFKENVMNVDFLNSILSQKQQIILQTQVPKQIKILEVIPDKQNRLKKIEYELIQQVKSEKWIYDFAIDQRNNILIAGMRDGYIKIYNFSNGKLGAEIQGLKTRARNSVYCLYCMKNTHSFVSGSFDKSITIWCLDEDNKWRAQQALYGHKFCVYCMIMNTKEDLLISGSYDKTVRFWRKLTDSWSLSQTVDAGGYVLSLSLNGNEDKLIAFTRTLISDQIIVMNIQSDQKWKTIQTIYVYEWGYRLCFTIQDQFVFQPITSDYLEVYDFDTNELQFYQKTKVKVQSVDNCDILFPCQYIQNLNIFTVKHGQFLNIFKVDQNGEYQLIQSIEYLNLILYGRTTDDGEYLITWDNKSKEIQVRKLKYKE